LEDRKSQGVPEGRGAEEADGDRKLAPLAPGQRWTVARKREVVLRLLRGEPVEMLSRELGVEIYRLERWRDKAHDGERAAVEEDGETGPFSPQEVEEVSGMTCAATGRRYGVELACRVWGQPRSSFYARRRRSAEGVEPARRGPTPLLTDEELLVHIRADLAASLFSGEGHRKVWFRLRVRRGIRVARKRVLRVMREHSLLSPHRSRQGAPKEHRGEIVTETSQCGGVRRVSGASTTGIWPSFRQTRMTSTGARDPAAAWTGAPTELTTLTRPSWVSEGKIVYLGIVSWLAVGGEPDGSGVLRHVVGSSGRRSLSVRRSLCAIVWNVCHLLSSRSGCFRQASTSR